MPQSEQARQHVEAVKALVEERKKSQENRVFAGPGFVHSRYGRGFIGQFGKGVSYRPDPHNKPLEYAKNDPTVDRQATHWWIPNSGARARLPKRANGVFSVHPQSRGAPLSMRFVGAAAVEGVEQPQEYPGAHIVLYEDVYPNIDLKATIAVKGLKIDYIFKAPGHPDYIDVQFPGPPASVAGGVRRFEEGVSRVTARDPWIDLSGIGKPGSIIYMDAEDRPGNIVRYRLPAGFSEPYPFTFDPSLQAEPDAHTETSTVDGRVTLTDTGTSFSTLRNAANGDTADDTATFYNPVYSTNFTSGEYDFMGRTFMLYDTSSIGASATINGASFWGRQSSHTDELDGHWFHIVSSAPASNTALATGDYDSLGTTPYTDGFTSGTVPSTGGRFRMQLNSSGIAAISKTGITKFGLRLINDIDNTAPGSWVANSSDSWSVSSSDSTYDSGILEVAWDCAPILTEGTDFTGTTAVTASITPTSGETVFAAVAAQGSGTFSGVTAPTISGCGLTWTLVKNSYHSGSSYWYSIWKGTGTPSTGSITFTFEASINTKCTWVVLETVGQTLAYTDSWADSLVNLDSDGVAPYYPDPSLGQTSPASGDVLGIIMGNQYGAYGGDGHFNTVEHAGTYNTYHIKGYQNGTAFTSNSNEPVIRVIVGSGAQTEMNWGYISSTSSDWQVAAAFQLQDITQTNKILSESLNMTESAVDVPSALKILSETLNLSESNLHLFGVARVISETLNLTESNVTWVNIVKVISESLNMAQSVYSALIPFPVKVFRATGMGIRGFKDGYNLLVRSFRGKRQQTRGFK